MDLWKRVTVMVTVVEFSTQMRPMESFLTAYLTGPGVGVTLDEVSNVLTPISLDFAVPGALLVLLLSDYLRYKPVMAFCGIMGILAYMSLIVSSSTISLKVFEVCFSLFTCIDPTYFGYLFTMIKDKNRYQIATGCVTAAILCGKSMSGLLGQLVIYLNKGDYSPLRYYSLAGVTFGTIWIFFLPSANRKSNSHVTADEKKVFSSEVIQDSKIPQYTVKSVRPQNINTVLDVTLPFKRICEDVKNSYTDLSVLRWSFWYIMGMTSNIPIISYINILYTYVADESDDYNMLLNGLVNSLATLCAAFSAYGIGKVNLDWTRYGDTFLAFGSLILGLFMCACYHAKNIFKVYFVYICYNALVQSMFVIAISQIGKQTKNNRYALLLGLNALLGIILSMIVSTILTCVGISIPKHFLVYGVTFIVVGITYGCVSFYNMYVRTRHFYYHLP